MPFDTLLPNDGVSNNLVSNTCYRFVYLFISACLYVCLSLCLLVCLTTSVSLPVLHYIGPLFCLTLYYVTSLSFMFLSLCVCLSQCLLVYLTLYIFVHLCRSFVLFDSLSYYISLTYVYLSLSFLLSLSFAILHSCVSSFCLTRDLYYVLSLSLSVSVLIYYCLYLCRFGPYEFLSITYLLLASVCLTVFVYGNSPFPSIRSSRCRYLQATVWIFLSLLLLVHTHVPLSLVTSSAMTKQLTKSE